jgi:hypothetical protein
MDEAETTKALTYLRENRWILSLERTLEELVGSAHETLSKTRDRPVPVPGSQRPPEPVPLSAVKSNRIERVDSKPLLLQYKSGVKRAILAALTMSPKATDAQICRSLDAEGAQELPPGWKNRPADRSFFDAYSSPSTRHKVENAISKVRRDLRERGFL